jgi:hypothetical protein
MPLFDGYFLQSGQPGAVPALNFSTNLTTSGQLLRSKQRRM